MENRELEDNSEIILDRDSDVDSDLDPDSDIDEEEFNGDGETGCPNYNLIWNKVDGTVQFKPNLVEYDNRRPRFNQHNPPVGRLSTPLDILQTFLDDSILLNMIEETNRYADQIKNHSPKVLPKWTPVTDAEFWSFLGLQLLTGLVKKPCYKDYWSTDDLIETPMFPKTMSRTRFEHILRSFHLADNGYLTASQANKRLWKLGSFLPELMANFEGAINVGEYLCVDESLLLFKGRLSFKQYMPLKRSRFGIKYFALVDCETKFLAKLEIYLGKSTNVDSTLVKELGLGGATVISLLDGYCRKNHKVVLDNWFNSPKLLTYLSGLKTYGLGTVRKNRKLLPKNISTKIPKGGVESYCTKDLPLERWQDRREVLMLNSFVSHEMKDSASTNPINQRMKPASVLLYNKKMGGVDDIDQQLAPYESLRKSIKWYKKLAFHLIDLAVYNSFIVYKHLNVGTKMTYKQFLTSLVKEILSKNKICRKVIGRPTKSSTNVPNNHACQYPEKALKDNKAKHRDCCLCKTNGKRKTTPFMCETCQKFLCIGGKNSCFKKFHQNLPTVHDSTPLVNSPFLNSQSLLDCTNDPTQFSAALSLPPYHGLFV